MASQTPEGSGVGWGKYQRFSELIFVSFTGHAGFAAFYGLWLGEWHIAVALALAALTVLSLFRVFKAALPAWQVRGLSHVTLLINMGCLELSLMWMGLSGAAAGWWLVWWPMFVAHVMGVVDGLIWVGVAMLSVALIWLNHEHHWVLPLMPAEHNPVFLMQLGFLLVGGGVSVVVRRAYDRFEARIEASQRLIDEQNKALASRAEKLEAMLQALQQSSLDRTRLFAQISHEVRTPLNGLLGFAQLLKRTPLNPQQAGQVEHINQCGATLLQIIGDVLDFSRLEAQATPLAQQPFDAVQVANEAADMVSPIAHQKGVALVRDFSCPEINAVGDPLRVKQVMLNLLANALKFTSAGEVAVRCRTLALADGQPGLHVEVQDSGIGIPQEAMPHLFQPFSRASDQTIRQYGGSGLGLAICKRLVDMMDGHIGVDSQPGCGSLFWFQVPIRVQ